MCPMRTKTRSTKSARRAGLGLPSCIVLSHSAAIAHAVEDTAAGPLGSAYIRSAQLPGFDVRSIFLTGNATKRIDRHPGNAALWGSVPTLFVVQP